MARMICVHPCTLPTLPPAIPIPFAGSLAGQVPLDLKIHCGSCASVTSLMNQMGPVIAGLGLPIKILGCVGAVIGAVQAVPAAIVTLSPTKITDALEAVTTKCAFIIQLAIPGVAPVCQFIALLEGIVTLIESMVDCIEGLLQHVLVQSLRANIMLADPGGDLSVRTAGQCLLDVTNAQQAQLGAKLVGLQALVEVLTPIFQLIETAVPGTNEVFDPLIAGLNAMTGTLTTPNTPLAEATAALNAVKTVLQTAVTTPGVGLQALAQLCADL